MLCEAQTRRPARPLGAHPPPTRTPKAPRGRALSTDPPAGEKAVYLLDAGAPQACLLRHILQEGTKAGAAAASYTQAEFSPGSSSSARKGGGGIPQTFAPAAESVYFPRSHPERSAWRCPAAGTSPAPPPLARPLWSGGGGGWVARVPGSSLPPCFSTLRRTQRTTPSGSGDVTPSRPARHPCREGVRAGRETSQEDE